MKNRSLLALTLTLTTILAQACGPMNTTVSMHRMNSPTTEALGLGASAFAPFEAMSAEARPTYYRALAEAATANPRCRDLPSDTDGTSLGTYMTDTSSDFGLLVRTIYGESDFSYTGEAPYLRDKQGVAISVIDRFAMVNNQLFMKDDQGYRYDPWRLGFVSKTASFGNLRVKDVVLYKPKSNFNAFVDGGNGALLSNIEDSLTAALDARVNDPPLATGTDANTGLAIQANTYCLNAIASIEQATSIALDYNRSPHRFDDPWGDQGATTSFNILGTNPGGFMTYFGKGSKTSFYGIQSRSISYSRPPERPKDVPFRFGTVKPSRLLANAADYTVGKLTPGGEATLFGSGLKPGAPVALSSDPATKKFPTQADGLQVLFNDEPAELLYASDSQINLIIPNDLPIGEDIHVMIVQPQGYADYDLSLSSFAPGLYYADSAAPEYGGSQWASGWAIAYYPNGSMTPATSVARFDAATGWGPNAIHVNVPGADTYLSLLGTGFSRENRSTVAVTLIASDGRVFSPYVEYAGPSPDAPWNSQLNVFLPKDLSEGETWVILGQGSVQSNRVRFYSTQ